MEDTDLGNYEYYSQEETADLLGGLNDADLRKLKRVTETLINQTEPFDPDEILGDVFEKIIDGPRQLPKEVNILTAITNIVKSHISNERKKLERKGWKVHESLSDKILANFDGLCSGESEISTNQSLEHDSINKAKELRKSICEKLKSDFIGDQVVCKILEGFESGFKAREVIELYDLDKTEYESARKRINRYKNKHYSNGLAS